MVPKNLQKALPFKDKIVHKSNKTTNPEAERVAVIKEPHEREVMHPFIYIYTYNVCVLFVHVFFFFFSFKFKLNKIAILISLIC